MTYLRFSVPQFLLSRIQRVLAKGRADPVLRSTWLLSLLITLVLNVPYYLWHKFHGAFGTALAIGSSQVACFSFFLLLSASRPSLILLVPVFVLFCSAGVYFLFELGVYVNENTLGLVFETNLGEASDLISLKLLGLLLLGQVVAYVYVRRVLLVWDRGSSTVRALWAGTLFLLHLVAALQTRKIEVYDPPLGVVTNSYVYFRENSRVAGLLESRRDISEGASLAADVPEDLTIVFVIGETVRPDHLHINGYPRPTTPQVERMGFLSFFDVRACATNTRFAVPCLLTRGTQKDDRRPYEETSLISVFNRVGFESSWISLQGKFWEAIVPNKYTVAATAAIASEAHSVEYLNPTGDVAQVRHFDTDLIPFVEDAIQKGPGRRLLVLHTAGAHFHYASHYPKSHNHYLPICTNNSPRDCEPTALNNTYDNAMHFVDEVLGKLAASLKGRDALLVYVSDHGESLGEGGHFLHHLDSKEPEQNRVAMLLWASEVFRSRNPEKWRALSEQQGKKLAHEHVFHTLLDCSGIESEALDPALSLCRQALPRKDELPPNRLSIHF